MDPHLGHNSEKIMKISETIVLLQKRLQERGDVQLTALETGGSEGDTWQSDVVDLRFNEAMGTLEVRTHL